mgnify:CR=1 FL=1
MQTRLSELAFAPPAAFDSETLLAPLGLEKPPPRAAWAAETLTPCGTAASAVTAAGPPHAGLQVGKGSQATDATKPTEPMDDEVIMRVSLQMIDISGWYFFECNPLQWCM